MAVIQDLYALAYAPLRETSLLSQGKDENLTEERLLKELGFLCDFSNVGLTQYVNLLSAPEHQDKGQAAGASLYCLLDYLCKVQRLTAAASALAVGVFQRGGYDDPSVALDDLGSSLKEGYVAVPNEAVSKLVDTAPGAAWENHEEAHERAMHSYLFNESPDSAATEEAKSTAKGCKRSSPLTAEANGEKPAMVERFRNIGKQTYLTARYTLAHDAGGESDRKEDKACVTFKDNEEDQNGDIDDDDCSESARKKTDGCVRFSPSAELPKTLYHRRTVRKATGYTKFNFKDNNAFTDGQCETPKTEASEDFHEAKESDITTEADGDITSSPTVSPAASNCSRKRSALSGTEVTGRLKADEDSADEDSSTTGKRLEAENAMTKDALSSRMLSADSEDGILADSFPLRRASSVGIGDIVDIDDSQADHHWHDMPRHEDRCKRIRKRRPTGHPNTLKMMAHLSEGGFPEESEVATDAPVSPSPST